MLYLSNKQRSEELSSLSLIPSLYIASKWDGTEAGKWHHDKAKKRNKDS